VSALEIVRPDVRRHAAVLDALAEFAAAGEYPHGSGLLPDHLSDEDAHGPAWRIGAIQNPDVFAAFVDDMRRRADRDHAVALGLVPDDKLWLVEGDAVVGFLSVRRELNAFLLEEGGHVGYSVRPTARRRGVATYACARALDLLRAHGVDRALITCDDDNEPSARTILRNGGVLEDVRGVKRRYWVDLGPLSTSGESP
jgi:predicted acetyltransferase